MFNSTAPTRALPHPSQQPHSNSHTHPHPHTQPQTQTSPTSPTHQTHHEPTNTSPISPHPGGSKNWLSGIRRMGEKPAISRTWVKKGTAPDRGGGLGGGTVDEVVPATNLGQGRERPLDRIHNQANRRSVYLPFESPLTLTQDGRGYEMGSVRAV